MGSDTVTGALKSAADRAGELVWPMPLPEELRPSLDSQVADLANIGERNGGMMTAAVFLREFVGKDKRRRADPLGPRGHRRPVVQQRQPVRLHATSRAPAAPSGPWLPTSRTSWPQPDACPSAAGRSHAALQPGIMRVIALCHKAT